MPTPSKPVKMLEYERKSHRTKAELEQREEAESALLSGIEMQMWPSVNKRARSRNEFKRLYGLLAKIGKNDALYQGAINRYCMLKCECEEFEEKREKFYKATRELEKERSKIAPFEYYKLLGSLESQVIACDKQIMAKRKMMLDIEKENVMTIASALRTIPKQNKKDEPEDPMAALLARRK